MRTIEWTLRELRCGVPNIALVIDHVSFQREQLFEEIKRRPLRKLNVAITSRVDVLAELFRCCRMKKLRFATGELTVDGAVDILCDLLERPDSGLTELTLANPGGTVFFSIDQMLRVFRAAKRLRKITLFGTNVGRAIPPFDDEHQEEFDFKLSVVELGSVDESPFPPRPEYSHMSINSFDALLPALDPCICRLKKISTSNTSLSTVAAFLAQYRSLKTLHVHESTGLSELFEAIGSNYPLKWLLVGFLPQSPESDVRAVCRFLASTHVMQLSVDQCLVDGILKAIEPNKNLTSLSLANCKCSSSSLTEALPQLASLKELNLQRNYYISLVQPVWPAIIAAIPLRVRHLNIKDNDPLPEDCILLLVRRPYLSSLWLQKKNMVVGHVAAEIFLRSSLQNFKVSSRFLQKARENVRWIVDSSALIEWKPSFRLSKWERSVCRMLSHRNACVRGRVRQASITLIAVKKFERSSVLRNVLRDIVNLIAKCVFATCYDPEAWSSEDLRHLVEMELENP